MGEGSRKLRESLEKSLSDCSGWRCLEPTKDLKRSESRSSGFPEALPLASGRRQVSMCESLYVGSVYVCPSVPRCSGDCFEWWSPQ